jgi:ABC-type Fe3+/spermidine/putrescine transport system ATPase subunit
MVDMKEKFVEIQNLRKSFGRKAVLRDINLEITKGEIFGIFGPSGCGKTTLLRIVAGLEKLDEGEIFLRRKEVCSKNYFLPPEKRNVSFIFQDLALWPHMTAKEHLEFILGKDSKRIEKILETVGLEKFIDSKPEQLSGGEKQRLAIARALAQDSDIFLLDEPFSSLDIEMKERMKKFLLDVRKKYKLTIIYVTHDILDILDFCERVAEMREGEILRVGKPKDILKDFLRKIRS